MKEKEAGP
jgi:hypothetical protein